MRISDTKVMQWVNSDSVWKGVVILDEVTGEEIIFTKDELKEVVERTEYFFSHMPD